MTLYHSTGIIAASGGAAAKPGMVLLKPTSIAHSGTSASIGANGQVTFTAVTSLSLNGVFSATYDSYVISAAGTIATGAETLSIRLRASGTDATGTNYASQELFVGSTSVSGGRGTSMDTGNVAGWWTPLRSAFTVHMYGPFLAQPTAWRSVSVTTDGNATIRDHATTHSLSTSYDGFTLRCPNAISGALQVYGVRS